jgi:hypothetical protein
MEQERAARNESLFREINPVARHRSVCARTSWPLPDP